MITKQTASELWFAYDEIEKAEKLLAILEEQRQRGEPLNLRDAFGRPRGLQLGVPSGETSHRLYDVHPAIAKSVLDAHISTKKAELALINEKAKAEML